MSNASRSASSPVWYQRISAASAAASERRRIRQRVLEVPDDVANLGVVAPADAIDLLDDRGRSP